MKYLIEALRHPRDYEWRRLRPWQKHSEVLAVAGTVYIGVGTAFMVIPPGERAVSLAVILQVAELDTWGIIWAAIGILALASTRWPPASKTWGYTALTGMAACWSGAYLVGIAAGAPPVQGVLSSLVWGLVGYLWYAIAGLSNPDDLFPFSPPLEEHTAPYSPEA